MNGVKIRTKLESSGGNLRTVVELGGTKKVFQWPVDGIPRSPRLEQQITEKFAGVAGIESAIPMIAADIRSAAEEHTW